MAWTYKDGYGIRRSLSIGSLTGILFWVGGLAWRLEKAIPKARAPPALFYMAQILLVYSFTIVTPLVVAWKNAGRRRTQGRDTHRVSRKGWSWSAGISEREYDLSKQSFMAAMQDPEEHDSIERFAGRCFCIELVLFLDVYLALKMSIYKDIRQYGPNGGSAAPTDGNASISPLAHDMSPHHHAVDVPEPTPTHTADRLSIHSHSNSNPRTTRSLEIERHESAQLARGSGSQATLAASVSENLASLSSSISATMAHAFPEYSISDDTLISERLRCVLKTVVRTFMLPESPLAINVPHAVVCTFRDYLLGGPATFGMMEQVKEEVVNLLYSNVYIRYRQASTAVAAGEDDYLPDRYGHVHGQPKAYAAVFAPLFAIYIFYVLTTYSAFIYRAVYLRDKSLVERSVFLLSVHTLSGTLVASSALVHGFMANFPCFIDMWMLSVGYIMWFATIILYMARYYVVVRWHKSIETEQRVNPVTPDNLVEYMTRLRVATQGVYWQNAADLDAVVGTDQLAVGAQIRDSQVGDAQIRVGRPSLIGRILSWRRRREEEASGVSESDTKTSEQ
ncbi:hypothetical protein H4S04_005747, partial [Coemansia sp. S16]